MPKLLKAEFYRTLRRREFFLALAAVGVLFFFFYLNLSNVYRASEVYRWIEEEPYRLRNCIEMLQYYWGIEAAHLSDVGIVNTYLQYIFGEEILRETSSVILVPLFTAPMLLGTDFQKRTIHSPIYEGYSRNKVLFTKLAHYYIVSIGVSLLWITAFYLYNYGFSGLRVLPLQFVLRCLLTETYLLAAMFCVPALIACVTKNVIGASLGNLLWAVCSFFLYIQFPEPTLLQQALHPMLLAYTRNMLWTPLLTLTGTQWAVFLLAPVLWIAGTLVISNLLFRRADLK